MLLSTLFWIFYFVSEINQNFIHIKETSSHHATSYKLFTLRETTILVVFPVKQALPRKSIHNPSR